MRKGTKQPRIQIDLKKVEEYAQVCDSEEEIALALGISYGTFQNRKRDYSEFCEAVKRGKAKANVFVGGKLMQKIKEGDTASTIFYLKSRCGWRETSRQELVGKDGGPIVTQVAPDLTGIDLDKLKAARKLLYGKTSDTD